MAETTTSEKPKTETAKPASKSGKKAVILTGGHQYLVTEGDELEVELLDPKQQSTAFEVLLLIDGPTVSVGTPTVAGAKVTADIIEQSVKAEKVVAIRYKAKKRVRKVRGHRQRHSLIKIKKIS
ncbi:MAG TPA: 50S ribosomal protein L21 [Candidatus Saccharimonadales bacterium]|jgi:large subunit ribosomal protein L21|nr:50S ribosomal protein L21 [Candidatus Saccharimonadales bacterium]